MHLDGGLVVGRGREGLALLDGYRRVALDELGGHAAERLDTQRERGDVQQQHVLHVAREHAALNARADRHDLVGIHALVGFFSEKFLHRLLHERHPRGAAHQHDLVDVAGLDLGVIQRAAAGSQRLLHQIAGQLLEFRARELQVQVLGTRGVRRDERQVDGRLHRTRKLDLRLFGFLAKTLKRHRVARDVDSLILLELLGHPLDDPVVDVVAAQVRIAVRGLHLDHVVPHLEDGDVERAPAEVVHGDGLIRLLVESVGEGGGRGFVDDALDVETGDFSGVLRRLALAVVEIRGHRDDRLGHLLAQVVLRGLFELLQHARRYLGRGVFLAVDLDARVAAVRLHDLIRHDGDFLGHLGETPAHEAFCGIDGPGRVGHRLAFGHEADELLPVVGERHDAGRRAVALLVGDDRRLSTLHDGDDRVGGAQINSDYLRHQSFSLSKRELYIRVDGFPADQFIFPSTKRLLHACFFHSPHRRDFELPLVALKTNPPYPPLTGG